MDRIVLVIQESRQPEHPVAIGASRIATEGERQHLEHAFLKREGEAFHPPKHLELARGSGYDRGRSRNQFEDMSAASFGLPSVSRSRYKCRTAATLSFVRFLLPVRKGFAADVDVRSGGVL